MPLSEERRKALVNQMLKSLQDASASINELRAISKSIAPKLYDDHIDLEKLKSFVSIFSLRNRIYYGEDLKNIKSLGFTNVLRIIFGKRDVVTKDIQRIKHYLRLGEVEFTKYLSIDKNNNNYIEIRKCNFDVEISVDAIKMLEHYDTFCLFSGDADFVYLNNFLKKKGKKIIIVKGGYITNKLRQSADLIINAQNIKKNIAKIAKQKPD